MRSLIHRCLCVWLLHCCPLCHAVAILPATSTRHCQ